MHMHSMPKLVKANITGKMISSKIKFLTGNSICLFVFHQYPNSNQKWK